VNSRQISLASLLFFTIFPAGVALGMVHSGPPQRKSGVSGESCGAGKDLVVQALEHLRANSTPGELQDANQLLKRSSELCAESGEAWYFRSLVESRLGHAPVAAYALRQASLFPSEAQRDALNPFVLSTPPPAHAPVLPPIRQRWALIVGVGTFIDDPNIPNLAFTSNDAESFRDVLIDPKIGGFRKENVRLLTNGDATLESIKESLNWLARSASPDDLVVVYIASHGSARDADTAGANYILTHDTRIGQDHDPDKLYASALPMVQLADDVATRFKARRTAIFLDTCYSAGAIAKKSEVSQTGFKSASLSKAAFEQISQGSGRIIFAASDTEQESLQSKQLQHGYFTFYLIEALKKNPGAPLSQIYSQVRQDVSGRVDKDYELYGLHQTPVMSRSADDADFSMGVSPLPPQPQTAGLVRR
jgi:hypothetical protein